MKLSFDPKQFKHILNFLNKQRVILAWLVILGLFGFTLLQAQGISDPQIDEDYLRKQRADIEMTTINIDEDLQAQIDALLETPVNTDPHNLGTRDPFSP